MIAVACHDAGGAELVSSFVRRGNLPVKAVLSGPAESVFKRKLPDVTKAPLAEALVGASLMICGTSWPSKFECEAIVAAKDVGVPAVAILDHWINYRRRFENNGKFCWPDLIWVCDVDAEQIARQELPEVPVVRIENPYRLDIIEQVRAVLPQELRSGLSVLYVTEPTSEAAERLYGDPRYFGYTEEEALRGFLNRCAKWPDISEIIVRPHPTEATEKYSWACEDIRVHINASVPLPTQIANADIVVGCNSMAMVVATWVRKRVLCAIPEGGRGFVLPKDGIEFLNQIERPIGPLELT